MTGKDVLPERDFLEKFEAIKKFEYSLLGKESQKQTSVGEKQYKKFNNAFESNKKEEEEKRRSQ